MKRHPELWPHVPSNRYGIAGSSQNSTAKLRPQLQSACRNGKKGSPGLGTTNPDAASQVKRTNSLLHKNAGQRPASVQPSLPVVARRRDSIDTKKPENSSKSCPPISTSFKREFFGGDKAPSAPSCKLSRDQRQKESPRQQQPEPRQLSQGNDSQSLDDSDAEIDASQPDISAGFKENNGERNKSISSRGEEELGFEKARRELEELTRREAEGRKQRQLIVENILSKFSSN